MPDSSERCPPGGARPDEEPAGIPAGSSSLSEEKTAEEKTAGESIGGEPSSGRTGWAPRPRAEILAELTQRGFQFRRRLGQNFLFDPQLLEAFLDDAGVREGERILEVGTGAGTLTERMLERNLEVITAEIDPILIDFLASRGAHPRLTVVAGDALGTKERLSPALLEALGDDNRPYRLVANLPYAIATPLVMRLLAHDPRLAGVAALVQTEVAERWIARPGGKEFGPAAVLLEGFGRGKITRRVPGHMFTPAPRIESSFYVWEPALGIDRGLLPGLLAFTRGLFLHRRKMLRAILRDRLVETDPRWARAGVNPTQRPEELTVDQIRALHSECGEQQFPPGC